MSLSKKIEEGYFVMAHWDGTTETEVRVKEETKATIRCLPLMEMKHQEHVFLQASHRLAVCFLLVTINIF